MKRALCVLCLLAALGGRAAAQPAMIAHEDGTIVFGQNRAKVEVMNLPESGGAAPAVVTLFDGIVGAGTLACSGPRSRCRSATCASPCART